MTEQRFVLPYWISNNGDGSASLRLERSEQRAEREDALQNQYEGFAEETAGGVELVFKDGELYYRDGGNLVRVPLKGETVDDDLSDLEELKEEDEEDEEDEDY